MQFVRAVGQLFSQKNTKLSGLFLQVPLYCHPEAVLCHYILAVPLYSSTSLFITLEDCQMSLFHRLQQLDEENSELRSCVPCLRANIERLEEVKMMLTHLSYIHWTITNFSTCPVLTPFFVFTHFKGKDEASG